jgi:hypothetical protein
MSTFPILTLLDFTQHFVFECDTSNEGITEVFMQNQHLKAFKRRKLRDLEKLYPIYDKDDHHSCIGKSHTILGRRTLFG